MNKKLFVYDERKKTFRHLNKRNYNDDVIVGTIFFQRVAIDILKKYTSVCGYAIVCNEGGYFSVDIHEKEIVMFEGSYNCLPIILKDELVPYNITKRPEIIWSKFFVEWQFLCEWTCFESNGPFIKLCSHILGDSCLLKKCIEQKANLIMPINYKDLCEFTQNIQKIFCIDFYNPGYNESFNYIIDALLNGYHMNMTDFDVIKYCYQICSIVNKTWEEEYE